MHATHEKGVLRWWLVRSEASFLWRELSFIFRLQLQLQLPVTFILQVHESLHVLYRGHRCNSSKNRRWCNRSRRLFSVFCSASCRINWPSSLGHCVLFRLTVQRYLPWFLVRDRLLQNFRRNPWFFKTIRVAVVKPLVDGGCSFLTRRTVGSCILLFPADFCPYCPFFVSSKNYVTFVAGWESWDHPGTTC